MGNWLSLCNAVIGRKEENKGKLFIARRIT